MSGRLTSCTSATLFFIDTLTLGITIEWVLFVGPIKVSKPHRDNAKDNLYDEHDYAALII